MSQTQQIIYYVLIGVAVYFMFRRGGACCGGGHAVSHQTGMGGGCCGGGGGHQHGNNPTGAVTEMVKDPVCGMTIPKEEAIHLVIDGQDVYFCSEDCANQFRNKGGHQ